ncbi:hypothetical protein DFH09DRAFT_1370268 [Mycena vulgaris]|nr:hypothetical protein DFH09DRAFT_1370268 [Mycena vulgaris]
MRGLRASLTFASPLQQISLSSIPLKNIPAIPASSPQVALSRSYVLLLSALFALIGFLTGMVLVIRFSQRKVAARRAKCIDGEAQMVAGGRGFFVKRMVKTAKTATVSPADVLEKARKAPLPLSYSYPSQNAPRFTH